MNKNLDLLFKNKDLLDPFHRRHMVELLKQFEEKANQYSEDIKFIRVTPLLQTMVSFKVYIPSKITAVISRPTRLLGYVEICMNGDPHFLRVDDMIDMNFIFASPDLRPVVREIQQFLRYCNSHLQDDEITQTHCLEMNVASKSYEKIKREIKYEDAVRMSCDKSYICNDLLTGLGVSSLTSVIGVVLYNEAYLPLVFIAILCAVNIFFMILFTVATASRTITIKRTERYKSKLDNSKAVLEQELTTVRSSIRQQFKSSTM